jgi:hypothetical protein
MREIKFRVWQHHKGNSDNGWMSFFELNPTLLPRLKYQGFNTFGNFTREHPTYEDKYFRNFIAEGEFDVDFAVMQFTGLYDKNGREVYEGDVLTDFEEKDFICIIKWEDNRGHWACYDYKNRYIGFAFEYIANGLEVIGDIYENPELLSKE